MLRDSLHKYILLLASALRFPCAFSLLLLIASCHNSLMPWSTQPETSNKKIATTSGTEIPALNKQKKQKKPSEASDLWQRIQMGLAMDLNQTNPRITAELLWYKNNQTYFNQISTRAAPYLHFIAKEAEARWAPAIPRSFSIQKYSKHIANIKQIYIYTPKRVHIRMYIYTYICTYKCDGTITTHCIIIPGSIYVYLCLACSIFVIIRCQISYSSRGQFHG